MSQLFGNSSCVLSENDGRLLSGRIGKRESDLTWTDGEDSRWWGGGTYEVRFGVPDTNWTYDPRFRNQWKWGAQVLEDRTIPSRFL